jgi:hypothetical protein
MSPARQLGRDLSGGAFDELRYLYFGHADLPVS